MEVAILHDGVGDDGDVVVFYAHSRRGVDVRMVDATQQSPTF